MATKPENRTEERREELLDALVEEEVVVGDEVEDEVLSVTVLGDEELPVLGDEVLPLEVLEELEGVAAGLEPTTLPQIEDSEQPGYKAIVVVHMPAEVCAEVFMVGSLQHSGV
jgi:hypothetical protein